MESQFNKVFSVLKSHNLPFLCYKTMREWIWVFNHFFYWDKLRDSHPEEKNHEDMLMELMFW